MPTEFLQNNQQEKPHTQEPEEVKIIGELLLESNNMIMMTGNGNPELARKTAAHFGLEATNSITRFADNELRVIHEDTLRNKHAIIIQSPSPPNIDSHIWELGGMIRAARLGGAKEVTSVVPYFPYARSDRKDVSRTAPMGGLLAEFLRMCGTHRIISFNVHAEQIQMAVGMLPWDFVYAEPDLIHAIEENEGIDIHEASFLATDAGGLKSQEAILEPIVGDINRAMAIKFRNLHQRNTSKTYGVWYDSPIEGKIVVANDDMIDTGGSICGPAEAAKANGARKFIAVTPHGIFSRDAHGDHPLDKMREAGVDIVYTTNTLPHADEVCRQALEDGFLVEVDVSRRLADVIYSNQIPDGSVSSFLFKRPDEYRLPLPPEV